ncbi:MAG: heme-binding domain-containing protein, partial [Bacteroidetes bacterium]|nr:heme-binding domain-containing protein [Bacteroidota bacterium]
VGQFFRIDKTNPPADPAKDFITLTNPPAEIGHLLKVACYDCHSNLTQYPWYSNVAPVSWWVKSHITHGRKHLNFSTWSDYKQKKQAHKLEECYEELEKGNMPLKSYPLTHPEARLNDEQNKVLINWFKSQEAKTGGDSD